MKVRYFYETDCYTLNQSAFFYYPLRHRLEDSLKRFFSPRSNSKVDLKNVIKINDLLKKNILAKLYNTEIDWHQDLIDTSYVVFDTETTGLQPFRGDRITSLGAVVIENGQITDKTFDMLVNPQRPIPATASQITGITNEMVSDKPTIHEVLPEFLDFIGNKILVAHSAAFDLAFLNIELCRLAPVRILNPVIDTYLLSNFIVPDMIEYSLESLVKRFNVGIEQRHTALGDSIMTARVFLNLLSILNGKKIYTLDQLQTFLANQKNRYFTLSAPEQL